MAENSNRFTMPWTLQCLELAETCKDQFQIESCTLEAHVQEAVVHGSLGKTPTADTDILLIPLKYSNVKILQVVRSLVTVRSIPMVNTQVMLASA